MIACALTFLALAQRPPSFGMDNLDVSLIQQGWGAPQKHRSVEGNPLKVGGRHYRRGIGTHAESVWAIELRTDVESFIAKVGIDDEVQKRGSAVFQIWGDGKLLAESKVMRGGDPADTLTAGLKGVRDILLVVRDAGDGIDFDHADWLEPELILGSLGTVLPRAIPLKPEPAMKIASIKPGRPEIHGPRVVGCSAGKPFLFRIPVLSAQPVRFRAEGLPKSLTLDPDTGIIQGTVKEPARTRVVLSVQGGGTSSSRVLFIDSRGVLALTPPMGWNSWNVWGTKVTAKHVSDAADALIASGLAGVGYRHVNIDDAWEAGRSPSGEIQTNQKFPDMAALARQVHAKGLLLGIYSSPGPKTCAGYEGSYQHERQDAETYAKWGVDYLKHDWCSYGQIAKDQSLPELKRPYEVMRDALRSTSRDIVYSLCQYGMGEVWKWGKEVDANLWRTTGDIFDTYGQVAGIGFAHSDRAQYAGPGRWNDPDMLVVGRLGWGESVRPTRLTPNEQITHLSLWALLAAPLIIGCDLTQMDDFTRDLLMNPEVVDIDQDPLGKAATRVALEGDIEVWARPLYDGSLAVGLFNRGFQSAKVTARWKDLGLSGPQPVRNLWERLDLGDFEADFNATIPAHGCVLVKIGRPQKTEFDLAEFDLSEFDLS